MQTFFTCLVISDEAHFELSSKVDKHIIFVTGPLKIQDKFHEIAAIPQSMLRKVNNIASMKKKTGGLRECRTLGKQYLP